jgi:hypothetical protein
LTKRTVAFDDWARRLPETFGEESAMLINIGQMCRFDRPSHERDSTLSTSFSMPTATSLMLGPNM